MASTNQLWIDKPETGVAGVLSFPPAFKFRHVLLLYFSLRPEWIVHDAARTNVVCVAHVHSEDTK